jgi:hypothetical protein
MHADPNYKRLQYVRYADDFLIGIIGSKEDAIQVRNDVKEFLDSLKLILNLDKTKITHARDDIAHFLGTDIRITPLHLPLVQYERNGEKSYIKSNTPPILYVPTHKIVDRLIARGICHPGGKPRF